MGGSSGSSKTTSTVRYAPYIEDYHQGLLAKVSAESDIRVASNPYSTFASFDTAILNFMSTYAFNTYMVNYDIDSIWANYMDTSTESATVGALTQAESSLLDDEIENTTLPRYKAGLRDINSIVSTAFIIGKSNIESAKLKSVAKFDAEARYKMIPIGHDRWVRRLNWQHAIQQEQMKLLDFQTRVKMDSAKQDQENEINEALWKFTIYDFERAVVAGMQGATSTSTSSKPASSTASALGGALSGAAAGAMIGGPTGAVIGGAVGLASSFF